MFLAVDSRFVEKVIGAFEQWDQDSLKRFLVFLATDSGFVERLLVFLAVNSEFVEKMFGVFNSGFRIR